MAAAELWLIAVMILGLADGAWIVTGWVADRRLTAATRRHRRGDG